MFMQCDNMKKRFEKFIEKSKTKFSESNTSVRLKEKMEESSSIEEI